MRMFQFDPEDHRETYASQGWVHIRNGIDPEFLTVLEEFANTSLVASRLDSFAIKGKKEQSLYDVPPEVDFPAELFDAVSAICGLERATMTLSERHIQAYEPNAEPDPPAHKDRWPSQVSVGLSIAVPSVSRLVLYPYDHREPNLFNTSAELRANLQPHELPEVALRDAREVELADEPGDVVMFPGSTTWHLRRNSANSINLYFKLNDFDCDPLGEDPSTAARRERTLELLAAGNGNHLGERVPAVSRRLDYVSRRYSRHRWEEALQAALWGSEPFGLTPTQLELLQIVDGRQTLTAVIARLSRQGHDHSAVERDALTLLERGALDLVD